MPAERASVPDSPAIPTHNERGIHQETTRSGLQLALILVASFMVVLDFTIVNIALPSMERDFGVTTSVVQWVVTGYGIAFSGLLILGGRAADMLGRRRIFIVGLVVFSLASLAGGLAGDPVLLVASRIVQGAGAALVAPAALSLITTSVPAGPRRTRAIGLYGSMASVGFVAAACFVVAETRHPAPLVRPRLLLRPGLRNGATLAFLLGVWNGGELLVLSLYM
ncbi:MAG: MFS transporter, partial [Trebonia sp.]